MPNWCSNDLEVSGEKQDLMNFKLFARGKGRDNVEETAFDENKFAPYPEKFQLIDERADEDQRLWQKEIEKAGVAKMSEKDKEAWHKAHPHRMMEDGYNQGGYDWCIANWGARGICQAELYSETDTKLNYGFDTAWSPPIPLVKKMGEMFLKLKFKLVYKEEGMGFKGNFTMKNGQVWKDWCKNT